MDLQLISHRPTQALITLWLVMTGDLSTSIHSPVKDLIQDIQSGNGLSFGTGKLREMCKLLPDEGEVFVLICFINFAQFQ